MPSHKQILDYWLSEEQLRYIQDELGVTPNKLFYLDHDYPQCWACSLSYNNRTKGWRALEKAHIIPAALGGEAVVSNLVLLCSECNRGPSRNPETKSEKRFWSWLEAKEERGQFDCISKMMRAEIESYEIPYHLTKSGQARFQELCEQKRDELMPGLREKPHRASNEAIVMEALEQFMSEVEQ